MARQNQLVNDENAWRFRSQTPQFFLIDGQAGWPVLLCFFWPHLDTFIFAGVSMVVLSVAARYGYGVPQLLGKLRVFVGSRYRYRD